MQKYPDVSEQTTLYSASLVCKIVIIPIQSHADDTLLCSLVYKIAIILIQAHQFYKLSVNLGIVLLKKKPLMSMKHEIIFFFLHAYEYLRTREMHVFVKY